MAHPSARLCKTEGQLARNVVRLKKAGVSLVEVLRLMSQKDPDNATIRIRLFAPLFYQHAFTEQQAAEAVEINCLQMATEP